GPLPAGERAVRVAARALETASKIAAARREGGGGRLVGRCTDGDVVRRGAGRALIVGDGERDGVGPRRGVGVRGVLRRRRRAVAEGPLPAGERAVGVASGAGEAAVESGAARREPGGGRQVWRP